MQNHSIFTQIAGLLFTLTFFSCGTNHVAEEKKTSKDETETEMLAMAVNQEDEKIVSPNFKNVSAVTEKHVNNLILHYDSLKNALVQSDYLKTQKLTEALIGEVISFNNKKILKDEQDGFYLKVGAKFKNNAERILKSKDLNEQRVHFSALTSNLLEIVKAFGGNEKEVYYQFCPMAFDNTGGYWLSLDKKIENPYFGDKMLKCGVVRETIK